MSNKIVSEMRICVEYWVYMEKKDTKYVWVNDNDKYSDIVKKTMIKFGIAFKTDSQGGYTYYMKKHLCKITDAEDLMHDDIIIMVSNNEVSKTLKYLNGTFLLETEKKSTEKIIIKKEFQSPMSYPDYRYISEEFQLRDHPDPF